MRLIVANQTLGGERLASEIRERIARGQDRFYIVVPMIAPQSETQIWAVADAGFAILPPEPPEEEMAEARGEAERRSSYRLARMIAQIESAGGVADGEVGPSDPVRAVRDVLERRTFEEVIVSTLPAGISRWLKLDLPSRIGRLTGTPVTTVEAER
jgi:hypothetical protein